MKKRTYVGAVTRPISLTPAIRVENPYSEQHTDQHGTLTQSFDTLTGEYYPNRQQYPTLLGLHVLMEDHNTAAAQTEVVWGGQNTVTWEVIRGGVATAVTAQSTGDFTLSGNFLRVRKNQTVADGNVTVRATGTFRDSVGRAQTAVAEQPLGLSASTATNLVLLRDRLGTPGYVGEFFRLNPLKLDTMAKLSLASNWRKRCAVQLCDGTTPVPDAFTLMGSDALDEEGYMDTPEGSAFYFWFYRMPDGRLIRCTEDTEWLDAAWTAHGTASKEVAVDLTKVRQVRLVCRAGYIPYGQMEDYLGEDGILQPEKLYLGFREQSFDVGVELPDVERIDVADIAHCRLERTELASSSVTIVKRALVTAGGTTLSDLGETTPHGSSTQSWVERLYGIEWFVAKANGDEVSIGTGEWLQITPARLAALYGAALNADAMPQMSVCVEPRYPKLTGNNYVEGYQRGASAVTPSQQQGNKEFLRQIGFFLLDTTDNEGETTRPMSLQRNNILRFAGGGWAPVVGISAAMAADAELELWRRNTAGTYVKYCDAGAYDPEAYVEEVLRKYFKGTLTGWQSESDGGWPRLYKKVDDDYVEAHALLPWETTETKYTIGVGFPFGVYLLDHQVGESGWEWNGIFTDVTEWDGIDLRPYYLAPTAIAPGPCGLASGNKLRNFFWLEKPSGWSGGLEGLIDGCVMFAETGRHYPWAAGATKGATAAQDMAYARANNSAAGRSYPFAELGFHALNTLISSQELLHSRRSIFDKALFGSGISANDPCTTEQEWRENGGVRFREQGTQAWSYAVFSETTPLSHTESSSAHKSWTYGLNNAKAKEQVMESQLAASFAVEFGIVATTQPASPATFTMYGGRYWWMEADSAASPGNGYMNCRVYRVLAATLSGESRSTGGAATYEVEVVLRMSLFGGMNLSGDIYVYAQGGADVILTATTAGTTGLKAAAWVVTDQRHWDYDTEDTLTMADGADGYPESLQEGEKFLIEKNPHALRLDDGTAVNLANDWSLRRLGYSPLSLKAGGGPDSGECAYNYAAQASKVNKGKRVRPGLLFRGFANWSACCPRFWFGHNPFSNSTNRNYGCSVQALIGT